MLPSTRIQLTPHKIFPGRRAKNAILPVLCFILMFVIIVRDRSNQQTYQFYQNGGNQDQGSNGALYLDDTHLVTPETHKLTSALRGSFFLGGKGQKIMSGKVSTSLLYTYYPDVTDSIRAMFPNVERANTPGQYFVISPAIALYKGEIWTLLRVWLNYERKKFTKTKEYNIWQDNFLYMQTFNRQMNPVTYGSILGIPVPKQYMRNAGPGDPRMFEWKNDLYAFYYMPMNLNGREVGHMFMYNLQKHFVLKPQVPGFKMGQIDSNWSPLIKDDVLYFIYSYDPLRILQCDDMALCHFIGDAKNDTKNDWNWKHDCLRGGTPFSVYTYPYYIALAHTRVLTRKGESFYGVHLILLNTDPFHIVYVSAPIKIHNSILMSASIVRDKYIKVPFFYPLSLIIEDEDSIAAGVHINDHRALILRIKGVAGIIKTAIKLDKKYKPSKPITKGLLHKYTTVALEKPNEVRYPYKGIKF